MTEAQAQQTLLAHGAQYVTSKGGVEWWKARDGSWIAKQSVSGQVSLKKLGANACGC